MNIAAITGIGFVVPKDCITNDELVRSYNRFAENYNKQNPNQQLEMSSSEFIYTASGVRQRFVYNKSGILNIDRMMPEVQHRMNASISLQAEFALKASLMAIKKAKIDPQDIDAIIVSIPHHLVDGVLIIISFMVMPLVQ